MTSLSNFFKLVKQKIVFVLTVVFVVCLVGFAVNYYFNKEQTSQIYNVMFKASNLNEDLLEEESLIYIKDLINDIREEEIKNNGSSYSSFSYVDTSSLASGGLKLVLKDDIYTLSVASYEFNSILQARRFVKHLLLDETLNKDSDILILNYDYTTDNVVLTTSNNLVGYMYLIYLIPLGFVIAFIIILLVNKYDKTSFNDFNYNNKTTFKHPFKKSVMAMSLANLKDIKCLVVIALFLSMSLMMKFVPIPSGFGNLGLSFSFLFLALLCMLYGPVMALLIGLLSDMLGFFLFPTGFGFHLGYVLNAVLACFVYGLFFYKTKITFAKVLFARLIVNIGINAILGSIWYSQVAYLKDGVFTYFIALALPKNIFYLIPQSIFLFMVIKASMRVLYPLKLVDKEVYENITLI